VTLRKTKAGKVQYTPLSIDAVAILRALGPHDGDAHVFAWPDGRPWTTGYVTHAFGGAVEDAGVKDLHVHGLRHTFACRPLRRGGHLRREQVVPACLGGHAQAMRPPDASRSEGCGRAEPFTPTEHGWGT
jgi:integrase